MSHLVLLKSIVATHSTDALYHRMQMC